MGRPRIAILGDGRMGREVEQLAGEREIEVTAVLGPHDTGKAAAVLRDVHVAIEFSVPEAAVSNIELCLSVGCPVVVGTTGWYHELEAVEARVEESAGALLWAPNFSLGVVLMKALCERAGELLRGFDGFDVHLSETHHAGKVDAPSGTALVLKQALDRTGLDVQITSIRTGHVPGRHEVCIDGAYEQLVLSHEARSRRVFADGALVAALWLRGRTGVFTMEDVMELEGP